VSLSSLFLSFGDILLVLEGVVGVGESLFYLPSLFPLLSSLFSFSPLEIWLLVLEGVVGLSSLFPLPLSLPLPLPIPLPLLPLPPSPSPSFSPFSNMLLVLEGVLWELVSGLSSLFSLLSLLCSSLLSSCSSVPPF